MKLLSGLFVFLFLGGSCPQEGRVVSGQVTDGQGWPLAGVSVVVKGSNTGCITDKHGNYRFVLEPDQSTLLFRFVGFIPRQVTVTSPVVNVKLFEAPTDLDEVVVVCRQSRSYDRNLFHNLLYVVPQPEVYVISKLR